MAAPVFVTGDVPNATQVNQWFVNTVFARKTVNESIASSTVLQNDDDLFFSADASTVYHVTLGLIISAQTANDFKFDFTIPTGASFNYIANINHISAAASADDAIFVGTSGTSYGIGGITGTNSAAHIEGILVTGGTSGTFRLQWAQFVSGAGGTTLVANSFLVARRVG